MGITNLSFGECVPHYTVSADAVDVVREAPGLHQPHAVVGFEVVVLFSGYNFFVVEL